MLLAGQRRVPRRLGGFRFEHPDLVDAVEHLVTG
jgi:NAD dependent epimerase/dehydratase family enzyme